MFKQAQNIFICLEVLDITNIFDRLSFTVSNLLGIDPVDFATALVSNIAFARGKKIYILKTTW